MATIINRTNVPPSALRPPEPFIIDQSRDTPVAALPLLRIMAAELTRRIPALAAHGVSGPNANHMTLHSGRPMLLEIRLGPKCGGGSCAGGKAGQDATVNAIRTYLTTQRPEIRAGGMKYVVRNAALQALAWN